MMKFIFMWRGNVKSYWFSSAKEAEAHAKFLREEFKMPITFHQDLKR